MQNDYIGIRNLDHCKLLEIMKFFCFNNLSVEIVLFQNIKRRSEPIKFKRKVHEDINNGTLTRI